MTPREFQQCLDRWGNELGQWPAEQAKQGRQCLATSREARRAMDAAHRLDEVLGGLREHAAPGFLVSRIVAEAATRHAAADSVDRLLGWLTDRLWRPALLGLMLTTAGFLAGTTAAAPEVDPALAEEVMTLAFSDIYSELTDAQP